MNKENIALFKYLFLLKKLQANFFSSNANFLFKKSIQTYCHVFCKKEAMKIFYWQKEDCIINIRILIDKKR